MKQIQSKTIWVNGEEKSAELINVYSIYDDLETKATFRYDLLTIDQLIIASNTIDIMGDDYVLWNGDIDINSSAYNYVIAKLNLVLA